jgi:hypothetical protein
MCRTAGSKSRTALNLLQIRLELRIIGFGRQQERGRNEMREHCRGKHVESRDEPLAYRQEDPETSRFPEGRVSVSTASTAVPSDALVLRQQLECSDDTVCARISGSDRKRMRAD